MEYRKKREIKSPSGWMTVSETSEFLGISHSTLYRIYPDVFSEHETAIYHQRRVFKRERAESYIKEQVKKSI